MKTKIKVFQNFFKPKNLFVIYTGVEIATDKVAFATYISSFATRSSDSVATLQLDFFMTSISN